MAETEPINTAIQQDPPQEKTFTQAEVDALIGQRLAREMKGMPSKDEIARYRAWEAAQQTEQERQAAIVRERDEANTALAAAQAEIEQLKRQSYIIAKGLAGDEAEFIAFKAAKLVDSKTSFEQAVDRLMQEREQKPRFDWTASLSSGGDQSTNINQTMNALIRQALG